MSKQTILNQAMELYLLGIELERKRRELSDSVIRKGEQSKEAIQAYYSFKELAEKFDALEQKHISNTQRLMNIREVS